MLERFVRVSKERPCPVCGKPDWCIVSRDGDAAICPRTSEGALRYIVDAGYLHRLAEKTITMACACRWSAPPTSELPSIDAEAIMLGCCAAIRQDDIDMLAQDLGVDGLALYRLGIGWSDSHHAYTFPMSDSFGRAIGIRLRNSAGVKWAIRGSRSGLFIPSGLAGEGPLHICEGPTDTAAMLTLGFDAIGRPSCNGGTDYLIAGLQRRRRSVVIVADRDSPGWKGAQQLAQQIVRLTPSLKIVTPVGAKDARQWLRNGVTADVVRSVIANTAQWHPPKEISSW